MIKENGTSWTVADQFMTLFIGFFMWGWYIICSLFINYGPFIIMGLWFMLFILVTRIWWAIQFDGGLKNVFRKKN